MVRDFLIDVDKNIDWEIRLKGLKTYRPLKPHKIDAFGIVKKENRKLAYLYDIVIDDEAIEIAKKDKLFLEKCNFIHNNQSFQGSFIDALMYVKEVYNAG